jgi:hypothetical protein
MASLAVAGLVGSGTVASGGFLAFGLGLAATYIDQQFIIPNLFPPDPVEGPRIGELQLQASDEGAPINTCYGAENRVAGAVIWLNGLKEVATTEEVGGKGAPGQDVTTYTYFVDVAVAAAEGQSDGTALEEITKIWADTKLLYEHSPDRTVVSDQVTATASELQDPIFSLASGLFQNVTLRYQLEITSPNGGPDLSVFQSGVPVDSSGWTAGANNDTGLNCLASGKDESAGTSYVILSRNPADGAFANEAAGQTVTLFQDRDQFNPARVEDVTIHLGSSSQTADTLIESVEGASSTPAYRGVCYMVLKNLALEVYGNRIPNFTMQVKADSTETVGSAIGKILERGTNPFLPSEYDVSTLTDTLRGFTVRGPQQVQSQLQPLLLAFDVVAKENNGVLEFFKRSTAAEVPVDAGDLSAHEDGAESPRLIAFNDGNGFRLPSEVDVKYLDPDLDYQPGSQRQGRQDFVQSDVRTLDLPVVLTPEQARDVAARVLWTSWANRQGMRVTLPPSYTTIQENDVLTMTAYGEDFRMLVQRVDRGANGIVEVEGVRETIGSHVDFGSEADPPKPKTGTGSEVYFAPETRMVLFDGAPLSDDFLDTPGLIVGLAAEDQTVDWPGASVQRSPDDFNYTPTLFVERESPIGSTTVALASSKENRWDRANTLTVTLIQGSLSSRSEIDVLNGANHCVVGSEVVAFATATLSASQPNFGTSYDLTNLLRGLRGTEDAIGEHITNESFLLLNTGPRFLTASTSDLQSSFFLKPVPQGADEADIDGRNITLLSRNLWPFAVTHLTASRNGSNDITIGWTRRSRAIARVLGPTPFPLAEASEAYEVDILDGPGGSVLRTITSTASANGSVVTPSTQSCVYDAADQTADGLTPGAAVDVRIYQLSAAVGRGKFKEQEV